MDSNILLDDKNVIVMKLLHYFITKKNYNPIILQGVEDEIWLENLDEDYKVVRIVSSYIHNDEQFDFDKFKTRRILKKIKKKTLSLNMNVCSIFLNLGDNVTEELNTSNKAICIKITEEEDFSKNNFIKKIFPDLYKNLTYKEKDMALFMKITSDINKHNKKDAKKMERVFKNKKPIITNALIAINIILYLLPILTGTYNEVISNFSTHGPSIRAGEYYRLLTGMFLHGSFLHIAFNSYALGIIGSQIENYLGKAKFLIIYVISGIIGGLFSITFNGNIASIGASGAIFGLMGALLYFGYHYRVYLGNVLKSQIIPLILLNLFLGFINSGVDNFAHIGGLLGGLVTTMALGVDGKSTTFEKINGYFITVIFIIFILYMAFVCAA